jgi:hypothetical protein
LPAHHRRRLPSLRASSQRASGDIVQGDRFVLLSNWTKNLWKEEDALQRRLNDLAGRGYRIVFASLSDLVFERRPQNESDVAYLFLAPRPIAELESELNTAISQGARLVLLGGGMALIETRPSSGDGVPTFASRPIGESKRYEYQFINTDRPGRDLSYKEFEERLTSAVNDGFRVVEMVTFSHDNEKGRFVLLEKVTADGTGTTRPIGPVRLKWQENGSLSDANLNKHGGEGYRLRFVGSGAGDSNGDLLFEKSPDSKETPEYAVVRFWNSTPQPALNEAASRGFRLLQHTEITALCCGGPISGVTRLTMEKVAGTELVEYRLADLATLNAELNQRSVEETVVGVVRLRRRFLSKVIGTLIVLERPRR